MAPKSLLASYYPQLTLLRLKLHSFKTLLHSSYYFETKQEKTHDQMNSIGPPIYMIYTQTTHLEQTAIAAPIDTEAELFLCEEKNKRKKENKPEAIFYNLYVKKIQASLFKTKQTTTWFAEEIWSQLDKPP